MSLRLLVQQTAGFSGPLYYKQITSVIDKHQILIKVWKCLPTRVQQTSASNNVQYSLDLKSRDNSLYKHYTCTYMYSMRLQTFLQKEVTITSKLAGTTMYKSLLGDALRALKKAVVVSMFRTAYMYSARLQETTMALFRANTSPKRDLYIHVVVPASLLTVTIHTMQSFKHHFSSKIQSCVTLCIHDTSYVWYTYMHMIMYKCIHGTYVTVMCLLKIFSNLPNRTNFELYFFAGTQVTYMYTYMCCTFTNSLTAVCIICWLEYMYM